MEKLLPKSTWKNSKFYINLHDWTDNENVTKYEMRKAIKCLILIKKKYLYYALQI